MHKFNPCNYPHGTIITANSKHGFPIRMFAINRDNDRFESMIGLGELQWEPNDIALEEFLELWEVAKFSGVSIALMQRAMDKIDERAEEELI